MSARSDIRPMEPLDTAAIRRRYSRVTREDRLTQAMPDITALLYEVDRLRGVVDRIEAAEDVHAVIHVADMDRLRGSMGRRAGDESAMKEIGA